MSVKTDNMKKCIICFESSTGVRSNDYLVSTPNGHVFHFCCVQEFITSGGSFCPICDEDLRFAKFEKLEGVSVRSTAEIPTRIPDVRVRNFPSAAPTTGQDSGRLDQRHISQVQQQPSTSFCVQPDYIFKIVVIGDFSVGKSSLLQRYADDRFDPFIQTTIGCDLRVKVIQIAGKTIRLNLWDTAGQERHRAIVDMYLRKADGILFCFDITNSDSFFALKDWFQFSQRALPSDTLKVIVGTKSDLWSQRKVRSHQIQNVAESWNAQYIYTSAKDATNIEIVFRSLAALILENRLPTSYNNASTIPSAPPLELKRSTSKEGIIKLYNHIKGSKKLKKKNRKEIDDCCR